MATVRRTPALPSHVMLSAFGCALACLSLAGCAAFISSPAITRVTALTSSESAIRPLRRVLVQLAVRDLEARQFAEDRFVIESRELFLDVDFLPSHELFFPGRSYSETEVETLLEKNRIDAVLVVGIAGEGGTPIYVPRSSISITNRFGSTHVTSTIEDGGFLGVAPWAEFDMTLADLDSREVVWVATAKTDGRIAAKEIQLLRSFVEQGVEKLRSDGFLDLAEMPRPPVDPLQADLQRTQLGLATKTARKRPTKRLHTDRFFSCTEADDGRCYANANVKFPRGCSEGIPIAKRHFRAELGSGKVDIYVRVSGQVKNEAVIYGGQASDSFSHRLIRDGFAIPDAKNRAIRLRYALLFENAMAERRGLWAIESCRAGAR